MVLRNNRLLNIEIENQIDIWHGTVHGQTLKNMYENGTNYESICEVAEINYEDYMEEKKNAK